MAILGNPRLGDFLMACSNIGLLAKGIKCLLVVQVIGRSRVARPPAAIKAFIVAVSLM